MVGKRFFLITGGTVAGLGAVLSITPPQFGSTGALKLGTGTALGGGTSLSTGTSATPVTPVNPAPANTPAPVATPQQATPKKTTVKKTTVKKTTVKKTTVKATPQKTTTAPAGGTTPANTPAPVSTPKAATVSGTFTGAAAGTIFGPVQVQITIVNNVITKAVALTYPTGSFRDQQINQQAIPYLIQETLAAQSANIQGVGGASYTSQGWATSLQSAITKAGF